MDAGVQHWCAKCYGWRVQASRLGLGSAAGCVGGAISSRGSGWPCLTPCLCAACRALCCRAAHCLQAASCLSLCCV
eukprot:scaffold8838_cov85-Isochrysis_galbana.AAC.3